MKSANFSPQDSSSEVQSSTSIDPSVVLRVVFAVLIFAGVGLTALLGSPVPIGVAFALMFAAAIFYAIKYANAGTPVWRNFAEQAQLDYSPGNLWKHEDREEIFGKYRGHEITLSQVYALESTIDQGYVVASVDLQTEVEEFYVDNGAFESCVAEPARKIKENAQLWGELRRSRPLRVSVSEGRLHLHAGHIPADPVGFKLLCELLADLAEFLNGSGTGRG